MPASYMSEKIPHDCPVCLLSMRDMNDILSYEEYECCTDCQDQFVFRDLEMWKKGVRPAEDEILRFRKHLQSRASYLVK